ncbi:MAG: glycosyltransferase [Propionibacteriaceae bacterium]|nr:glycosyltransferase [Propionibacteriaceae bacterium]
MTTPLRVFLYSHDSQGLGHVRRNLALAQHLAQALPSLVGRPISGLLATGLPQASQFPLPPGFDWLALPGISKGDGGYRPRHLDATMDSLVALRSGLLETALMSFQPDLVIIDRHPFGVRKELRRPLKRLRRTLPGTRVVLGLREVLDAPDVAVAEWNALGKTALLGDVFDQVWVYGDRGVHDSSATGEVPPVLADRVAYTGFLAHGRDLGPVPSAFEATVPFVLTTVGGGSDGCDVALAAAAAPVPAGHQHLVVTGPQMAEADHQRVVDAAAPGALVVRSISGLSHHIDAAAAVISMGGYNSVAEILATDTPALVVPREHPRTEQLIRARDLASVGALDVLREPYLTPEAIGAWLTHAVARRVDRSRIERDGLTTVPHLAARLLATDTLEVVA